MTIEEFESEEDAAALGKLLTEKGFNELTVWWEKLNRQMELIDVARKSYLQAETVRKEREIYANTSNLKIIWGEK